MTEEKSVTEVPKTKSGYSVDVAVSALEQNADAWEAEERVCDAAKAILKILGEHKLTVGDSLKAMEKAKVTAESSVQSTSLGSPLILADKVLFTPALYFCWNHDEVKERVQQRREERKQASK